jgi:hypothetical protein
MEYADRVRTGAVTPAETAAFISTLSCDLAYWDERKREAEQVQIQFRDGKET